MNSKQLVRSNDAGSDISCEPLANLTDEMAQANSERASLPYDEVKNPVCDELQQVGTCIPPSINASGRAAMFNEKYKPMKLHICGILEFK